MPKIGEINFYISSAFGVPLSPAPANSVSNIYTVNGVFYGAMHKIINDLTSLLADAKIADFLLGLNGNNIYITEGKTGDIAQWKFSDNPPAISSNEVFYFEAPKIVPVDPDGPSGPLPAGPTVDPGASDTYGGWATLGKTADGFIDLGPGVMLNPAYVTQFQSPDAVTRDMELQRVLFHELFHGISRAAIMGPYTAGSVQPFDYRAAEGLAIDAENILYVPIFGGHIRVGHGPVFSSTVNDPSDPFGSATRGWATYCIKKRHMATRPAI